MQFKVPQFIDLEDRIVGPLTWLQFVYLLIGGSIAYLIFVKLPFIVFLFMGLPIGLLALALAFIKVQDQPFSKFLVAFLTYLSRPKRYLWKAGAAPAPVVVAKTKEKGAKRQTRPKAQFSQLELSRLAKLLDAGAVGRQPQAKASPEKPGGTAPGGAYPKGDSGG